MVGQLNQQWLHLKRTTRVALVLVSFVGWPLQIQVQTHMQKKIQTFGGQVCVESTVATFKENNRVAFVGWPIQIQIHMQKKLIQTLGGPSLR